MLSDLAIIAILLLLNGFFAAAEAAVLSVNPNKVKIKAEEGNEKAKLLKIVIDDPNNYLATIQVGISIISLFSGVFASQSFSDDLMHIFMQLGFDIPISVVRTVTVLVITLLLSYFNLVFGELVPKRVAMNKAESLSLMFISPINAITKITRPVVKVLSISTNFFAKLFGVSELSRDDITEEEIRMMIDVGEEYGSIDEDEKEMINNIFDFDNKTVGNICTHRTDIIALNLDSDFDEIFNVMTKERYSRVPVYEENIDNIVGILHIKDLINDVFLADGTVKKEIDLKAITRKPTFIPISRKTDELFSEMQKNKTHMTIVIDEYGGTVGLVTLEDLIEEVMGDILDEYDDEKRPEIEKIDETTFYVSGSTNLEDVAEFFDTDLPVSEYDTVSGFLIGQIGKIPSEDEHPEIEFNGLIFKIFKTLEKRITEVIVVKV